MVGLSSTWFMIALGVLAILVLALVMKLFAKPKRAEKWEKAEIMKQLLALSEQEEKRRLTTAATASRPRTQPARPAARPNPTSVKASSQVAIPVRAKAR